MARAMPESGARVTPQKQATGGVAAQSLERTRALLEDPDN
jgi:hypothetical protein